MQVTVGDYDIRIELGLPIPREAAWILLTSPDAIAAWWGEHVALDAREGGHFREEWTNQGRDVVTNGTLLHCQPPSPQNPGLLEMTWADNTWSGQTRVRVTLEDQPGGCTVVLQHEDWQHVHAQDVGALIRAHSEGWQLHLNRLAALAREVTRSET